MVKTVSAFVFGVLVGVFTGGLVAMLLVLCATPRLPNRPVDHLYGSSIAVQVPGEQAQPYYRWCDPTGYLLFANSWEKTATITAVKDARCEGVH